MTNVNLNVASGTLEGGAIEWNIQFSAESWLIQEQCITNEPFHPGNGNWDLLVAGK